MAPVLIERRTERSCDRLGRSWQHVVLSRHVTPAEFDAARACIPAAVDLQRAAGDERCGAELLEGMERDMAVGIAGLACTVEGRQRLSRVAGATLRLFEPLMAQARAVLAEDLPVLDDWHVQEVALAWHARVGRQPPQPPGFLDASLSGGLASEDFCEAGEWCPWPDD